MSITNMVYMPKPAWQEVGVKLPKLMTSAEAMAHAGLDYSVEKRALYTLGERNRLIPVEHSFATVRTDDSSPLGIVGDRYTVLQNSSAFEFFDALVGKDEAIYETAGVIGRGERVWLLAKMPGYIKIGRKDIVNKYVLLTNTFNGTSTVVACITPIRVVCQNTLNVALRNSKEQVRIRHTPNATEKLQEAQRILGLTNALYSELETIFNRMQLRKVSGKELLDYVKKLVPDNEYVQKYNTRTENIREKILDLYESGEGAELTRGTAFGLVNAVSELTDHVQFANNPEKRLKYVWFGSGAELKEKAFSQALAFLN